MCQLFKKKIEDEDKDKIIFVDHCYQYGGIFGEKNETLKDLKTRIYNNIHIPIHRQKLSFFNIESQEFIEETDDNISLLELQKKTHWWVRINFHPKKDKNDLIKIKVNDKRKYNIEGDKGDFYIDVDIFDNILQQICKMKNFEQSKSNLYLVYCNNNKEKSLHYYCEYDKEISFYIDLLDILEDNYNKKELQFNLCDFIDSPEIFIFVKRIGDLPLLKIKTSPSHPVGHLKRLIKQKTGREEELQKIILNNKFLETSLTLDDYNIQNEDTIHCLEKIHF